MIPGSANPLLLATADAGGYTISRSLRFNSADSAVLSRTFGTPTTQNTFTLSLWVKRAALGTTQQLFGVSTNHSFGFTSGNALNLTFGGVSALTTTAVFRDPSAWYHLVWRQNGTSHTLYVNNTSVGTATATSSTFNTAVAHQIAAANSANYFSGYLADIHFIDGQALDPTSFGEFSATTGVWMPKQFTGSYGTNGFKLDFADNSAATAAALGKDTSGNGNNWTPTNLSVTAGAGNDSLIDVPVNGSQTDTGVGGEVRGNYATLNPLDNGGITLTNGNLDWARPSAGTRVCYSTIGVSSGKWYFESSIVGATSGVNWECGVATTSTSNAARPGTTATGWQVQTSGSTTILKQNNNTTTTIFTGTISSGDIFSVALDMDNGRIWFGRNGTWLEGNPAAGTGASFTNLSGTVEAFAGGDGSVSGSINFGARSFAYTAPSGYKALNTANLPAPVVTKPSDLFDVKLYTGNGSTQTISGLGFSPDLVWLKSRTNANFHELNDTVRGAGKILYSNATDAEATAGRFTAFTSDGFSVSTTGGDGTNFLNAAMVGWCWDAGGSTVSNTAGTITSSVRANASAGFSVATYTGTGANATVGHGLGVALSLIIVKCRSAANDWAVYHAANTSDPKTDYLLLNSTAATADDNTYWNDTAPTSTVFSIGTNADVNTSTATYIAYCFAPVAGYSSFGSYTGNGSADGPFVFCNFRPRWVMVRRTDAVADWWIYDAARNTFNVANSYLRPNRANAEGTDTFYLFDLLSNGFKLRSSDADINASNNTYVWAAFAEVPFQYSRAR
jgi:hypothetical protein